MTNIFRISALDFLVCSSNELLNNVVAGEYFPQNSLESLLILLLEDETQSMNDRPTRTYLSSSQPNVIGSESILDSNIRAQGNEMICFFNNSLFINFLN